MLIAATPNINPLRAKTRPALFTSTSPNTCVPQWMGPQHPAHNTISSDEHFHAPQLQEPLKKCSAVSALQSPEKQNHTWLKLIIGIPCLLGVGVLALSWFFKISLCSSEKMQTEHQLQPSHYIFLYFSSAFPTLCPSSCWSILAYIFSSLFPIPWK